MASAITIAGDIAGAATALAGLLLVFIGAVTSAFDSFEPAAQSTVRGTFRWRGWLALVGFFFALGAAGLSLAGKWNNSYCLVVSATVLLGLSLLVAAVAAVISVLDIK